MEIRQTKKAQALLPKPLKYLADPETAIFRISADCIAMQSEADRRVIHCKCVTIFLSILLRPVAITHTGPHILWRVGWLSRKVGCWKMPKVAKELSAVEVKRLAHPGQGRNVSRAVGGVSGLQLQITPSGGRTWLLRTQVGGKRREIGLGGFPTVSLAQARERARAALDSIRKGVDPVEERKAAKAALAAAQSRDMTFAKCPVPAHCIDPRHPAGSVNHTPLKSGIRNHTNGPID